MSARRFGRSFGSRHLPITAGACFWALCATAGCRRGGDGSRAGASANVFERGDLVIVERTAAEFFEGRVLSMAPGALKVQTSEEGEPVTVVPSDAYRVERAPRESTPGAPAICSDRPAHWAACRVIDRGGTGIRVSLGSGSDASLPADRVLRPSAVTALNIKKLFEVGESRRRFDEAAVSAGQPRRPSGWLPEVREPVIARRGDHWFTAHVSSMLEDGGVRVVFVGADRPEAVPGSSVVPMPPYTRSFSLGDFALARPKSASEPWARVRIDAMGPEEAVVVDEAGERQRFEVRQLVPLMR